MSRTRVNRRRFVQTAAGLAVAANLPHWFSERAAADESKNDRPILGCIGAGGQGTHMAKPGQRERVRFRGDRGRRSHARRKSQRLFRKGRPLRRLPRLLERKDIEAVTDRHARPLAHRHRAGRARCRQARLLRKAADADRRRRQATGRGRQADRQDLSGRHAAARRSVAHCSAGPWPRCAAASWARSRTSRSICPTIKGDAGPYATAPVPSGLNWDLWQGQAPAVDYVPERCHYDVSLVVRILRRHADRLGRPPPRHHAVGARHGQLRPDVDRWHPDRAAKHAGRLHDTRQTHVIEYQYPGDITSSRHRKRRSDVRGRQGTDLRQSRPHHGKPIEEQDADPAAKKKS